MYVSINFALKKSYLRVCVHTYVGTVRTPTPIDDDLLASLCVAYLLDEYKYACHLCVYNYVFNPLVYKQLAFVLMYGSALR